VMYHASVIFGGLQVVQGVAHPPSGKWYVLHTMTLKRIVTRRRTGSDIASAPGAPLSKTAGGTGARVSWLELCGGGGQLRDRVQTG